MEYNYDAYGYGSDYLAGTSTGHDVYPWQEDQNVASRPSYYYDSSQHQRQGWAFPTSNTEFFTPMDPTLLQNNYQYANIDSGRPPHFASQYPGSASRGYVSSGNDWTDSRDSHSRHAGSYHQSTQLPSTPAQIHINPSEPTPPSSHSWDSAVYCCWQVPGRKPGTLVDCGEKFTELEFANHIRRHFERSNAHFTGDVELCIQACTSSFGMGEIEV
ncbi:hypothetical protein E1B28_005338 [Marasmius oreades]|uniref:Uncharacterized protein n=1 Tax=Marasmius oreades TaxID=181124 RepID=A0A9P7S3M8_9AGAR|nr:uncharacterized protein E1B28_005338 [Marasmius oreades]KAG7094507.1 hypothetical protein E1B28_005338 [Marasmius oreades]